MSHMLPAQAGAQFVSLLVLIAISRWYLSPWLAGRGRAEALTALLWVNVFRYVALQIFAAQREGFPISDGGALEIVIGDVAGAVIAFAAILLLRRRSPLGIALSWLLAAETIVDTFLNIRGGMQEHLLGAATGVTWMILAFYVPAVVVSIALLITQLVSRRGEALGPSLAAAAPSQPPVAARRFA